MNQELTPEEFEALLALGGQNAELQAEMERQQALASGLRTNDFGQMRGNGRIMVAPSIAEVGGNLLRNYKAGQMEDAIKDQSSKVLGNTQKQNQMVLRSILGGMGGLGGGGQPPGMTPGFNPYEQLKFPGGSA